MIDMLKKLLQVLLIRVNEAYQSSKDDRKKIHKIEWEVDDGTSILGESEIRAGAVIGLVKQYIDSTITDKEDALLTLRKYSVYRSPDLLKWLLKEGNEFSNFTLYLENLEHLRLTLQEIIIES